MSDFTTALVINDLHLPFHSPRAVKLVMGFAKSLKPDTVFLNGDIIDAYEMSRFDRDPRRGATIDKELKMGTALIQQLRGDLPKSRIVFVEGNHEHRIRRYIVKNAPSLTWVQGLKLPALLELDKYRVEYIECDADRFIDTYVQYGPSLLIGHFATCRGQSGATARALLDQFSMSCVQGHTHSIGSANKLIYPSKQIAAWENGCLASLHPSYCNPKNWCHCISVIHKENRGSYFQLQQLPIINYQFRYGDRHWRG